MSSPEQMTAPNSFSADCSVGRMRKQPNQSDPTTRRLAIMNLAIRGIEADFGPEHADTFRRDLHPDFRADYVLANPPFNDSDTALRDSAFIKSEASPQVVREAKDNFRKDDDARRQWSGATWTTKGCPQGERWGVHQFGVPPRGNANFAWVQHFISN